MRNMRKIFTEAHKLTREIKAQYPEVDYRAQFAITLSYLLNKEEEEVILKLNHQPSGGKEWVAEITGRHPKWKFNRQFLKPVERDWSSSGKTGTTTFVLEPAKIYEINEPWGDRYFARVQGEELITISAEEVLEKF